MDGTAPEGTRRTGSTEAERLITSYSGQENAKHRIELEA